MFHGVIYKITLAQFFETRCMNWDSGSYLLPSSYDKLLLRDPAHFHRNDTTRRRLDSHFWRRRRNVKFL